MQVFKCNVCGADSTSTDEIRLKCDRCGRIIPPISTLDLDGDPFVRIPLCDEDGSRIYEDGNPLWLIIGVAAGSSAIFDFGVGEEPEPCDRHYCGSCLAILLEQALAGMKSGVAWKIKGDESSAADDDDEKEAVDA